MDDENDPNQNNQYIDVDAETGVGTMQTQGPQARAENIYVDQERVTEPSIEYSYVGHDSVTVPSTAIYSYADVPMGKHTRMNQTYDVQHKTNTNTKESNPDDIKHLTDINSAPKTPDLENNDTLLIENDLYDI